MLSYCDVPLPILNAELTPDASAFISRYSPLDRIRDRDLGRYYGSGEILNFPIPSTPRESPPELGVLWWPTGASECATFSSVVNVSALALIRTASAASEFNDLVISDGTNTITASMKIASVHPLFQIDDTEQLYLLTLVDVRYNWWWKPGSLTQSETWADLFAQFGTLLDVTINAADVNAAYAIPSIRWTTYYKPLPTLLDAAATYVGQRVIAALDGTISTVLAADANTNADTQFASFQKIVGGNVVDIDIYNTIPGNVVTVFGQTNAMGIPQASPYTQSTSLASLSLVGYDGAVGLAELTATVFVDLIYDTTNLGDCNTLASQASTDWYLWNLADVDVTLPGIQPWIPTGSETAIEWTYAGDDRLLTRIIREPWQVLPTGSYEFGVPSESPSPPYVTGCVVTNVCPVFSSGVQTGVMVEKTCPDGSKTCTINPSDCCPVPPPPPPPLVTNCSCYPPGLPQTLYLAFSGFTDNAGCDFSCLNGVVIPLIYSSTGAFGGGPSWSPVGNCECFAPSLSPYYNISACNGVLPCGDSANCAQILVQCLADSVLGVQIVGTGESSWFSFSAGQQVLMDYTCEPFCWTAATSVEVAGAAIDSPCFSASSTGTLTITASSSGTCGDPPASWNCSIATGGCVEVFDGSGAYSSLTSCTSSCSAGASSWNCVSGGCVKIGGTGGTYATEADCIAASCGAACPNSGNVTLTVSGPNAGGSYTLTWSPPFGGFLGSSTFAGNGYIQALYNCFSSTTGSLDVSIGYTGGCNGTNSSIALVGTVSPLDMTGTGTLTGPSPCAGSYTFTIT